MLPLLCDIFPNEKIIAVGTKASIEVQKEVLKENGKLFDDIVDEVIVLESEHDFDKIFAILSKLIETHRDVIVDISHSFRHIPILMTVNMLIENIVNPQNIKYILFAKELEREQNYEIIDLSRYIELSTVSYALASFNDNYTIVKNVHIKDKNFQALLKMLAELGEHILASSFEALFKGKDDTRPLLQRVETTLEAIIEHPVSLPLHRYLKNIKSHISELGQLIGVNEDVKYYTFAKLMYQKGFMLNAITLLDEAISRYALEMIRRIDSRCAIAIEEFEKKIENSQNFQNYDTNYSRYELVTQAKNVIKYHKKNKKDFLGDKSLTDFILSKIDYKNTKKFRDLIFSCDKVRNDLAHGNTFQHYENIKIEIGDLVNRYSQICNDNYSMAKN
jgi:CRISPR-associated DxTHG motif protein